MCTLQNFKLYYLQLKLTNKMKNSSNMISKLKNNVSKLISIKLAENVLPIIFIF